MSAWEYEAPTTIFDSEVLDDPFLLGVGRLRQKGDVDLLRIVSPNGLRRLVVL